MNIDVKFREIAISVFIALLCTGLVNLTSFLSLDTKVSDLLFQKAHPISGEVMVVGIDSESLTPLGSYEAWDRQVIAKAIRILNEDPQTRPTVIGIDLSFPGQGNAESDKALVEAAEASGNVVLPCIVNFRSTPTISRGEFSDDDFKTSFVEEPFSALKAVTLQGHVNWALDEDGILRHHLLRLKGKDAESIASFAQAVAELYAQREGKELQTPPASMGNCMYIPFSGNPGDFDSGISFVDILDGNYSPDTFAHKIVLIGPYTKDFSAYMFTSINSREPMYSIEYQANVVQALLNEPFKIRLGMGYQNIIFFFMVFLCTLLYVRGKTLPGIYVCAALIVASLFGSWAFYYIFDYVSYILRTPLILFMVLLIGLLYNYILGGIERKKIKKTFSRYMDPKTVNQLLTNYKKELKLGGESRTVVAIFADIRGFSAMAEALDPAELMEIVNKYLSVASEAILRHGGMVDKFMGDCVMGLFNVPLPQKDYAYSAVLAAMDIIKESAPLNETVFKTYGHPIGFGVGLNLGEAVVGNFGSDIRMTYTAIGEPVSSAAKIEVNTPAGRIYMGSSIAEMLKGRIVVTALPLGRKRAGLSEDFAIFRLDGLSDG